MAKKKAVTSRTTVRLPDEVHHKAKVASAQAGMKIQDFVAKAVLEKIANINIKNKPA